MLEPGANFRLHHKYKDFLHESVEVVDIHRASFVDFSY
jgi:hypothetical protein